MNAPVGKLPLRPAAEKERVIKFYIVSNLKSWAGHVTYAVAKKVGTGVGG